jgi:N-sulfoglucosamine sulfohydrolase
LTLPGSAKFALSQVCRTMNGPLRAVIAGCFWLAWHALALAADKPNLVVFLSDDHGYLDSSAAGAPDVATPNMERLMRDGMTFTHACAISPSCAPSRAALLTGLTPLNNGSMFNHQPPRAEVTKLPAYLHELGYEVVAFGKVAHYKQGKDYGFDLVRHDTFHDDECVPAALRWLADRESDRPLCLMIGTNWPHVPWPEADASIEPGELTLPPTHVDTPRTRAARARYYAAIRRMDEDLGLVYDAVYRELGPNTLFVHFSDHGAQWPFAKWNLYDAGLRVPMFATWPGVIEPGSRCEGLASLLDVLPTLIQAGGGVPPELAGQSLLPLMTGEESDDGERVLFATHSGDGRMNAYPMRSVRTASWRYIRNLTPEAEYATHITRGEAVDGRNYWRSWLRRAETDPAAAAIIERYQHRPAEELYDLSNDPLEQHNLAADPQQAAVLGQLRGLLDAWMAEQGDRGLDTEKEVAAAFLSAEK